MKVALFTDTFYEINGVANTYKKFFDWCVENKKNIDFFVYDDSLLRPFVIENFDDVNLIKLKPRYSIKYYENLSFELIRSSVPKTMIHNYSTIHIATPGSMGLMGRKLAKNHNLKMVGVYHTKFEDYVALKCPSFFQKFIRNCIISLTRLFYKDFSIVLAPTPKNATWIINNKIGDSAVLARGIDHDFFVPIQKKFNKNIIYIGRISEEKNLYLIKKAYDASDKTMNVIFTGDGPYKKEFQNMFPEAVFQGYKTGKDLVAEYQRGDLFVFPSLTDTYGNVVQEAMACGVPCLVLDSTGPGEIINDQTDGFLAKNEEDFIYLFNKLINSPILLKKISKRARLKMVDRTWDKVFTQLWNHYEI